MLLQDRGPHETARIRGGRGHGLPREAGGKYARYGNAALGILAGRVYGRVSDLARERPHVRPPHQGGRDRRRGRAQTAFKNLRKRNAPGGRDHVAACTRGRKRLADPLGRPQRRHRFRPRGRARPHRPAHRRKGGGLHGEAGRYPLFLRRPQGRDRAGADAARAGAQRHAPRRRGGPHPAPRRPARSARPHRGIFGGRPKAAVVRARRARPAAAVSEPVAVFHAARGGAGHYAPVHAGGPPRAAA